MSTLPPHPDTTLTLTPAERAAFDGVLAASGAASGWGNVVLASAPPQPPARPSFPALLVATVGGVVLLVADAASRWAAERWRR